MRWAIRDQTQVSDVDSDQVLLINFEAFIPIFWLHQSASQMIDVIAVRIGTVFIHMEAQAFISYKRFLTRHLYEPFLHFI